MTLTIKYNKQEGRFCLCVGIIDLGKCPKGEKIGLYEYTTKDIISIKNIEKLVNGTVAQVTQLPHDHK